MHYLSIDDADLYVGRDGYHRSAIARFAFHYLGCTELHGVAVSNYIIDWEAKNLFDQAIEALAPYGIQLEPEVFLPVQDDGIGWMQESYRLDFKALNLRKGRCIILSKQDLQELISKLQNINWVNRIFKGRMGKFKEVL